MIGGTCGVEVAPVSYLNENYQGDLAVVWLDAHGDLNTPSTSPSGHFHGMALRTLLGEGPKGYIEGLSRFLNTDQVFLAGSRNLNPAEMTYISKVGISITTPREFGDPSELVQKIKYRGFKHLYLHLDLDVLNVADLMVLNKNPLDEIENTNSILYVMKNGRLYEAATLTETWPRQLPLPTQWWWRVEPPQ